MTRISMIAISKLNTEGNRKKTKVIFLIARPLAPAPPSSLVATFSVGIFLFKILLELKKKLFFLVARPLPPPPLPS